MLGVLLPVAQALPGAEGGGLHEDSLDSLVMLAHSRPLRLAAAASVACMAAYNVAGGRAAGQPAPHSCALPGDMHLSNGAAFGG